jgi:hypothetical protein
MFEHVTILLSIIFALAMTHILASATELVWQRRNIRFYGLHALWMANALLGLLCYWLSIWELAAVRRWTGLAIVLQFIPAIVQYFACSLLSMRREGTEIMDMKAFYERQRPAIFVAFPHDDRSTSRPTRTGTTWQGTIRATGRRRASITSDAGRDPDRRLGEATVAAVDCRSFIFGLEALFLGIYAVRPEPRAKIWRPAAIVEDARRP